MFDIGFWELGLILLIALLILGPERLPRFTREIGFWVGRARASFYSMRKEMDREFQVEEMRKAGRDVQESVNDVRTAGREASSAVDEATRDVKKATDGDGRSAPRSGEKPPAGDGKGNDA